jgi:hypothetical protein
MSSNTSQDSARLGDTTGVQEMPDSQRDASEERKAAEKEEKDRLAERARDLKLVEGSLAMLAHGAGSVEKMEGDMFLLPSMKLPIHGYQVVAVGQIAQAEKAAETEGAIKGIILADDMGLGSKLSAIHESFMLMQLSPETVTTIAAIVNGLLINPQEKTLLVVPAALVSHCKCIPT